MYANREFTAKEPRRQVYDSGLWTADSGLSLSSVGAVFNRDRLQPRPASTANSSTCAKQAHLHTTAGVAAAKKFRGSNHQRPGRQHLSAAGQGTATFLSPSLHGDGGDRNVAAP
jgi:hypothetical protein